MGSDLEDIWDEIKLELRSALPVILLLLFIYLVIIILFFPTLFLWSLIISYGVGYLAFGIDAGFYYIKIFKIFRKIENIPTSIIKSGAVGSRVEIKGEIISYTPSLISEPYPGLIWGDGRSVSSSYICPEDADRFIFIEDSMGDLALVFYETALLFFETGPKFIGQGRFAKIRFDDKYYKKSIGRINIEHEKKNSKSKLFDLGESIYIMSYAQSGLIFFNIKNKEQALKPLTELVSSVEKRSGELTDSPALPIDKMFDHEEYYWVKDLIKDRIASEKLQLHLLGLLSKTVMIMGVNQDCPLLMSKEDESNTVRSFKWISIINLLAFIAISTVGFAILFFIWEVFQWVYLR
jgi:hypothetical protein